MAGKEGGRKSQEEPTYVTGPIKLEPGQSFYKQFPLEEVVAAAARPFEGDGTIIYREQTLSLPRIEGIDGDIRHLLTDLSRMFNGLDPRVRPRTIEDLFRASRYTLYTELPVERQHVYSGNIPESEIPLRIALQSGVAAALKGLSEYPEWHTYISGQQAKGIYKTDGTFIRRERPVAESALPSSYLAWLQEREKTQARIRDKLRVQVVGEAFPQQTKDIPFSEVIPQGPQENRRKWEIRKGIK